MKAGIAVIGASETGIWTQWLLHNLERYGWDGPVWLINPGRDSVFGRPCLPALDGVKGDLRLGVVITSPTRAVAACEELVARRVPEILLISNGFRETGTPEGASLEVRVASLCRDNDVQLIGPNCVGFARFGESLCAIAEPIPQDLCAGDVSLVSNSGAMLSGLLHALSQDGVGLDACYSIGNGAAFDLADAVGQCAQRASTRVVCALVEAIPDRGRLAAALRGGRERGCEFVFLLLGQSESAKAIAASHTGAVLGEGRLARAWLESEGAIVVTSVGELAHTAALLSKLGRQPAGKGVMIVSGSGGACGLGADILSRQGVPMAELSPATIERVRALLPQGAFIGNPLDIVSGTSEERGNICRIVGADPGVSLLLEPIAVVWPDHSELRKRHQQTMSFIAEAASASGVPYVLSSTYPGPLTDFMKTLQARPGIAVQAGVEVTAMALRHIHAPQQRIGRASAEASSARGGQAPAMLGEHQGRQRLAQWGLPLVPGAHAAHVDAVLDAAREMRGPWVVKIGNAGIAHKGRIGGVRVGLCDEAELRSACAGIAAAAFGHGVVARPEDTTFLVQQMVFGPELLVSAVRDAIVGDSLTVGLGGWAAEAGHIFLTVPLPAQAGSGMDAFAQRIAASRLASLIGPSHCARLAQLMEQLAAAFQSPQAQDCGIIECNPVILADEGALVADVLILGRPA